MKYTVFHAATMDYMTRFAAGVADAAGHLERARMPHHMRVAFVEAEGVEQVYALMQTLERPWWENKGVSANVDLMAEERLQRVLGDNFIDPRHSMSVGDIIVEDAVIWNTSVIGKRAWVCASAGFVEVTIGSIVQPTGGAK
jgi:hypothetical protein